MWQHRHADVLFVLKLHRDQSSAKTIFHLHFYVINYSSENPLME